MSRLDAIAAVLLVLMAGCSSPAPTAADGSPGEDESPRHAQGVVTQDVRVTRDSSRGPAACHPGEVGRLVTRFFRTVNRGEPGRAVESFTERVGWYSVTEGDPENGGRHFVAYEPEKLRTYLRERATHDERMYLIEMDVGYERSGNLGHVAYSLLRTADDLADYAEQAGGKGAIDCDTGRIAIWSMGQGPKPAPGGGLCPGEADPPELAVVCARR